MKKQAQKALNPATELMLRSLSAFGHDWQTIAASGAKLQRLEAKFSKPITNTLRFYRVEKPLETANVSRAFTMRKSCKLSQHFPGDFFRFS
jgi:hypothetical protein